MQEKNSYKSFTFYAESVLFSFALLYCCLYCGRLNLSLSITTIMAETSWTTAQIGILSSVLFWGYATGHLINGRLSELIGSRKLIITGVLVSVAMNLLISIQSNLWIMGVLFLINGYAQSMVFSPGLSQMSKWWPADKRGFSSGVVLGCAAFAQVVAWFAVLSSFKLAPQMGWRAAFRLPMLIMLVSVIVYYFLGKESPASVGLPEYTNKDSKDDLHELELSQKMQEKGKLYPYKYMLSQWKFLVWLAIIFITYICRYGLITWIPKYYVEIFGTNISDGIMGTVFLPLGMSIGCLTIPIITDKLCPKNRMPAVIISSAFAAVSVVIFQHMTPGIGASVLLFVVGFFVYSITGVGMAYATQIGGRVFSGTASGILDWAANMGGSIQALIFGFMLTSSGGWNNVFYFIIAGCIIICILSVIVSFGMNKERLTEKRG